MFTPPKGIFHEGGGGGAAPGPGEAKGTQKPRRTSTGSSVAAHGDGVGSSAPSQTDIIPKASSAAAPHSSHASFLSSSPTKGISELKKMPHSLEKRSMPTDETGGNNEKLEELLSPSQSLDVLARVASAAKTGTRKHESYNAQKRKSVSQEPASSVSVGGPKPPPLPPPPPSSRVDDPDLTAEMVKTAKSFSDDPLVQRSFLRAMQQQRLHPNQVQRNKQAAADAIQARAAAKKPQAAKKNPTNKSRVVKKKKASGAPPVSSSAVDSVLPVSSKVQSHAKVVSAPTAAGPKQKSKKSQNRHQANPLLHNGRVAADQQSIPQLLQMLQETKGIGCQTNPLAFLLYQSALTHGRSSNSNVAAMPNPSLSSAQTKVPLHMEVGPKGAPAPSNTGAVVGLNGMVSIPCRARGMPPDHNFKVCTTGMTPTMCTVLAKSNYARTFKLPTNLSSFLLTGVSFLCYRMQTAHFIIPSDVVHGQDLVCSYPACRDSGVKFRYCIHCRVPVAKRNFKLRHNHMELGTSPAQGQVPHTGDVNNMPQVPATICVAADQESANKLSGHVPAPMSSTAVAAMQKNASDPLQYGREPTPAGLDPSNEGPPYATYDVNQKKRRRHSSQEKDSSRKKTRKYTNHGARVEFEKIPSTIEIASENEGISTQQEGTEKQQSSSEEKARKKHSHRKEHKKRKSSRKKKHSSKDQKARESKQKKERLDTEMASGDHKKEKQKHKDSSHSVEPVLVSTSDSNKPGQAAAKMTKVLDVLPLTPEETKELEGKFTKRRLRLWSELLSDRPARTEADQMSLWLLNVMKVSDINAPLEEVLAQVKRSARSNSRGKSKAKSNKRGRSRSRNEESERISSHVNEEPAALAASAKVDDTLQPESLPLKKPRLEQGDTIS
jgi:hypothetical protein